MKFITTILLFLIVNSLYAQSIASKEKFRELEPDIWLSIWDKVNSDKSIRIDTLSYEDIPQSIDFRGTVVEALRWSDATGQNILIQSVTGNFNKKVYGPDSTIYDIEVKSELYTYLFRKKANGIEYERVWKMYDFNQCYGVDWYTGFIPKSTTITDLDKDGISEVTIPYVLICRGGVDPGIMKMMMYEDKEKFALRGSTLICIGKDRYGGEFTASENLKDQKEFSNFLIKHWKKQGCEDGRFN